MNKKNKQLLSSLICAAALFCASLACAQSTATVSDYQGFRDSFADTGTETISFSTDIFNITSLQPTNMGNTNKIINGNGHILDGNKASGLLIQNNGGLTLTLKNITLQNMNVALELNNCPNSVVNFEEKVTFYDNTNSYRGGAICINANAVNSTLAFKGSDIQFLNNKADYDGGAIYLTGSTTLDFLNTNLTAIENKAKFAGGFLYLLDSSEIRNVLFGNIEISSNNAGTLGGAIYAIGSSSKLVFSGANTEFSYNHASDGGAIYVGSGVSVDFSSAALKAIGNSATGSGGFMFTNGQIINFGKDVEMSSNTASGSGGALYLNYGSVTFGGTNTAINFNTSSGNGGAISLNGNATVDFSSTNLTAIGNKSTNGSGGFLYLDNKTVSFYGNVEMSSNTAGNLGGALYLNGGSVTFGGTNTTITTINFNTSSSSYSSYGGAIYLSGSATLDFSKTNLTAIGNNSYNSGGFLCLEDNSNNRNILFGNVEISSNSTKVNYGGAIYAIGSFSKLVFLGANTEFNYNHAATGGAIYAASGVTVDFSSTVLKAIGNRAENGNGGFMYVYGQTINFGNDVEMSSNTAGNLGGALYLYGGSVTFGGTNTVINFNTSSGNGGAISLNNATVNFSSTNLTAIGNQSTGGSGGFLYLDNKTMPFYRNVDMSNNYAAISGGALYLTSGSSLTFYGDYVVFSNNVASSSGGAVAVYASGWPYYMASNVTFNNAQFTGNTASSGNGGAVYIQGNDSSHISSATFNTSAGKTTLFDGNTASGAPNSVYADSYSYIYFNTDAGGNVEMHDGISGTSLANIYVQGDGNFNFYGNVDSNKANLFLGDRSNFNFKDGANFSAGEYAANDGSTLNMANGQNNTFYVSSVNSSGTISMDVNTNNSGELYDCDQIISSGSVSLGSDSKLILNILNGRFSGTRTFELINYGSIELGSFTAVNYSCALLARDPLVEVQYGTGSQDWITVTVEGVMETAFTRIGGLTPNQKATAAAYDALSATSSGDLDFIINTLVNSMNPDDNFSLTREYLTQASGYFLANVVRSGAVTGGNEEVYDRIKDISAYAMTNNGLWAQANLSAVTNKSDPNSPQDYSDNAVGGSIGFDRYLTGLNVMAGVYGKFGKHNISQDSQNTAGITNAGLGIYGGYIQSGWEVKALIGGSVDSYETNRRIPFVKRTAKADFSGMSINFDAEAALKRPLYKEINLRPYLGFEIKNSNYGSISETGAQSLDMNVSAGSYSRSALRFGAGVNQGNEKYGWHLAAEYKYLVSGNLPEIETEFEEGAGQKFNIVGSEEGKGEIGFKLGGMIRIVKDLRVYADMSCHTADRYSNLYGNVGIRWSFSAQPQPQNKKLAENKEGLSAAAQAKAKAKAEAQAKAKDKAEKAESNRRIVQSKMAAEINERRQRQIEISKAETESETSANIKEFELKSAQQKKIQKEISSTAAQKNDESKSLKKQPKQPADAETGAVKEQEPRTEGLRVVKSSFDVRFTPNAYALSGYWDVEVQKQIDEIKKMDFKKITIEGHADSTEKDGKKISKLRAKSVFDAFVNNGIPADKIDYAGFSSTLPIAKEDTEAGKMANRRVTVIVE